MAFVRIKRVKGIDYAYYVENTRTERGKVKQVILQYLGRADKIERKFKNGQ